METADQKDIDDTIAAIHRTIGALQATGVPNLVLISVLSGTLMACLDAEAPDRRAVFRQCLAENFAA